jgi:hypothetical protein
MNMLAMPSSRDASEEELRTAALPPVHPAQADVLDGILAAGVAGDVERPHTRSMVWRLTARHSLGFRGLPMGSRGNRRGKCDYNWVSHVAS